MKGKTHIGSTNDFIKVAREQSGKKKNQPSSLTLSTHESADTALGFPQSFSAVNETPLTWNSLESKRSHIFCSTFTHLRRKFFVAGVMTVGTNVGYTSRSEVMTLGKQM